MKPRLARGVAAFSTIFLLVVASCGTGSTGFDKPTPSVPGNSGPTDGGNPLEERAITDVLVAGGCVDVHDRARLEPFRVCSNDPPAGLVDASLAVSELRSRCPAEGCLLELRLAEEGAIDAATQVLAAWRVADASGPWRTADALLERDASGLRSGEILVPVPVEAAELQVALLIYPAGIEPPSLGAGALLVSSLEELGAPEATVTIVMLAEATFAATARVDVLRADLAPIEGFPNLAEAVVTGPGGGSFSISTEVLPGSTASIEIEPGPRLLTVESFELIGADVDLSLGLQVNIREIELHESEPLVTQYAIENGFFTMILRGDATAVVAVAGGSPQAIAAPFIANSSGFFEFEPATGAVRILDLEAELPTIVLGGFEIAATLVLNFEGVVDGPDIFGDSFEAGTFNAWSSHVP